MSTLQHYQSDEIKLLKRKKKTRTVFSRSQVHQLETTFDMKRYLSSSERVSLAHTLQLSETQVKIWFQNRRNKWKRQIAAELENSTTNDDVSASLDLNDSNLPQVGRKHSSEEKYSQIQKDLFNGPNVADQSFMSAVNAVTLATMAKMSHNSGQYSNQLFDENMSRLSDNIFQSINPHNQIPFMFQAGDVGNSNVAGLDLKKNTAVKAFDRSSTNTHSDKYTGDNVDNKTGNYISTAKLKLNDEKTSIKSILDNTADSTKVKYARQTLSGYV